jgi:hypothetical protein
VNELELDRMAAIEAACYRAVRAMENELISGLRIDPLLMLIAALEAIESERIKRRPGLSMTWTYQDAINHLRHMAVIEAQSKALRRRALRKRQTRPWESPSAPQEVV